MTEVPKVTDRRNTMGPTDDLDEIEAARHLLARSFHGQPHFVDLFPSPLRRERALPHVFGAVLADAATHGRIDTAKVDGRLSGVAIWYPPRHYPLSPIRQLRALPAGLRMALTAPLSVSRVIGYQAEAARLHPVQPYWYLATIGVDPTRHGSGVGTRLLAHGLKAVDASDAPAYLETHTPRGVAWYSQHGFVVDTAEVPFTAGGPPNWTMLRPGGAR